MRGGYPIRAVTIHEHRTNTKSGKTTVKIWCEAMSPYRSRLHTACGHKHKTLEAAQKCVPIVEAAYRAKRWPKKVL